MYLGTRIRCLEEDPTSEQLCKYAPNRPHIDGSVVVFTTGKEFWCTIVLRHHLKGHGGVAIRFYGSGKSEITDFEEAVAVD